MATPRAHVARLPDLLITQAIAPLAGNDTPARIRIDAKRVLQRLEN